MSASNLVLRLCEWLIRQSCRCLPPEIQADCRAEWLAELPAIRWDTDTSWGFIRSWRMFKFSAGQFFGIIEHHHATNSGPTRATYALLAALLTLKPCMPEVPKKSGPDVAFRNRTGHLVVTEVKSFHEVRDSA